MKIKAVKRKQYAVLIMPLIFVFTFLFLLCDVYPVVSSAESYLNELFDDLKNYKTVSKHRGDLYEHSQWVERYLSRWAYGRGKNSETSYIFPLMEKLTHRQKELLAFAGALHDIGKAGDPDCSKYESFYKKEGFIYYFSKKDHERIGFEYILHDVLNKEHFSQAYLKVDGKPYSFDLLFNQFKFTKQEQLIIAVLVGSHRIFSELFFNLEKKGDFTAYDIAAKKLKNLIIRAACGQVDHLIDMVVLLAMADLYGTYYPLEFDEPSLIFEKAPICKKVRDFPEDAGYLGKLKEKIDQVGLSIKNKFEEKYKAINTIEIAVP